MFSLNKFSPRSFDWPLFLAAIFLVALGLTAIYSVDLSRGTSLFFFKKQLIAMSIGLVFLVVASLTQYTWFRAHAKLFYVASLVLLVGVLLFGTTIRGARSWFVFGGFSFQPLEVAKVGVILLLAYIVYRFGRRFERPLFFVGTGLVTALVIGLIVLERDLGSAFIIGCVWFGIMILVGARRVFMIAFVIAGIVLALFAWQFILHDYQKERVRTFLNPERDALGAGYNSTQAIIAIGAGQWFGRGLARGSQSQLRFLPEAQTDFIFSVIGEELGFAGVLVLIILFAILLWRLLVIVRKSNNDFAAVTVSGIAILFFVQFFVNVAANLGLLPITGVTLPFVSYGGSSLIVNLGLIGIAESMVGKKY